MSQTNFGPVAKVIPDVLSNTSKATEQVLSGNIAAMTDGEHAAGAAFKALTAAYQDMASRNASNLAAAMHELSAVRNPIQFFEIQQRLIKEGVHLAVTDSQTIAHLTATMFTKAFEPVKKQIESLQTTKLN
jgi:hypothetical protein